MLAQQDAGSLRWPCCNPGAHCLPSLCMLPSELGQAAHVHAGSNVVRGQHVPPKLTRAWHPDAGPSRQSSIFSRFTEGPHYSSHSMKPLKSAELNVAQGAGCMGQLDPLSGQGRCAYTPPPLHRTRTRAQPAGSGRSACRGARAACMATRPAARRVLHTCTQPTARSTRALCQLCRWPYAGLLLRLLRAEASAGRCHVQCSAPV